MPAVLILLVGAFGVVFNSGRTATGQLIFGAGGSGGVFGGVMAGIGAFIGLMLVLVGTVRGLRRPAPHNGRSVGIAGFTLEIGVIIIAVAALALLAFSLL
jgi:hypothetical protein